MSVKLMSTTLMVLLATPLAQAQSGVRVPPEFFGNTLTAGLDAQAIIALIAPGRDASLLTLAGAKAWPYRPNSYVAIACFAHDKREFDAERSDGTQPGCRQYRDRSGENVEIGKTVYLGVIEKVPGRTPPTLVASYGKALDIPISWKGAGLAPPLVADPGAGSDGSPVLPEEYERFDFAPYNISATQTAIGLRVGWNERYTGAGMGDFHALMLFKIEGSKLVNIFSEPISFYRDSNDGRDEEGNRKGLVREGTKVLSILPGTSDGYHDLQLKTLKGKWKEKFVWDGTASRYVPAPAATRR